MAGIPSIYIQRIAVRILDARRFAKILLVADLLGRIPIHQHPTILTGEPLRVTIRMDQTRYGHRGRYLSSLPFGPVIMSETGKNSSLPVTLDS